MQKPLKYYIKGLSGNSITRIIPQAPTKNQVVSEISSYIQNGALTNALDLLEKRDITGDTALFVLANLQVGGASPSLDKWGQASSKIVVEDRGSTKQACPHLSWVIAGGES